MVPYSLSRTEKDVLENSLDEHLRRGSIEESNSPVGALVLVAKKKDGGSRPFVDFRGLNTIEDRHPLPLVQDPITIKNHHPLPLAQDSWDRLCSPENFEVLSRLVCLGVQSTPGRGP